MELCFFILRSGLGADDRFGQACIGQCKSDYVVSGLDGKWTGVVSTE